MLSGFATVANLLNLPLKDDEDLSVVAAAVRRWLESNSGWLLVLDDVDDLALVREFAPAGAQGHLLMTKRLQATGESCELVELKKMLPDEGALLLLRRAKGIQKDQPLEAARDVDHGLARQISTQMDGLPLALDQAGAFIEETPSSLAEYLTLYRAEGAALRARRGDLATSHDSVTITFSLAFNRVAKANRAAADVVCGCAFLAPDAIPEEVFTEAGSEWGELIAGLAKSPLAWVKAIAEARRFALIHRDAEHKTVRIHRLVQEVVKDEMSAASRHEWVDRVVRALNRVFPFVEFQSWPQCERLLPHARMAARLVEDFGWDSPVAVRLLNQSAYYLGRRGQYAEAETLYCHAVAIQEKALGPYHPDTAQSLNNLGTLYQCQNGTARPRCSSAALSTSTKRRSAPIIPTPQAASTTKRNSIAFKAATARRSGCTAALSTSEKRLLASNTRTSPIASTTLRFSSSTKAATAKLSRSSQRTRHLRKSAWPRSPGHRQLHL